MAKDREFDLPDNLYRELERRGQMYRPPLSVEALLRRGIQWVLVEDAAQQRGGDILIYPDQKSLDEDSPVTFR